MLNSMKEFYDDYKEMVVKPEKEFYSKHMVGVVLINAVPITLLFMGPTLYRSVIQLKDKVITKKNKEEEIEA